MRAAKIPPDEFVYSSVISACARGRDWDRALEILSEMRLDNLVPNVVTYTALITALRAGNSVQDQGLIFNS